MSLVADANGVINGKFTIPAGVPVGTKLVEFEGAGGSRADAAFVGSGKIVENFMRTINTVTQTFADPLAQTFSLTVSAQIAAVDLWFAAVGTSDIEVQIRDTATGLPTSSVVARTRIAPGDVNTTTHTRIAFESPVFLQANTEYALVVMCDDAVSELRLAELGKFDSAAQRWITSQPYQIGVMLSSSNASTWTPHQDRDLTFRLHRAVYTSSNGTVNLGTVAVTDATDLIVRGLTETPASSTFVMFDLELPGGQVLTVADGQRIQLAEAVTGDIKISAKLSGSADASPVLFAGSQLIVGTLADTGDYVSRAVPAGTDVTLKVIFEAVIPSGATVDVYYKGPDNDDDWAEVPMVDDNPADDGFVEFIHEVENVTELTVQIKIEMAGTPAARPRIRDLRIIVM